jgi:hypothetical protein
MVQRTDSGAEYIPAFIEDSGMSKISHFQHSLVVQQHVFELQITMHDTLYNVTSQTPSNRSEANSNRATSEAKAAMYLRVTVFDRIDNL